MYSKNSFQHKSTVKIVKNLTIAKFSKKVHYYQILLVDTFDKVKINIYNAHAPNFCFFLKFNLVF